MAPIRSLIRVLAPIIFGALLGQKIANRGKIVYCVGPVLMGIVFVVFTNIVFLSCFSIDVSCENLTSLQFLCQKLPKALTPFSTLAGHLGSPPPSSARAPTH